MAIRATTRSLSRHDRLQLHSRNLLPFRRWSRPATTAVHRSTCVAIQDAVPVATSAMWRPHPQPLRSPPFQTRRNRFRTTRIRTKFRIKTGTKDSRTFRPSFHHRTCNHNDSCELIKSLRHFGGACSRLATGLLFRRCASDASFHKNANRLRPCDYRRQRSLSLSRRVAT